MKITTQRNDHRTLPPGQKELDHFPRYGLFQYATRIDTEPAPLALEIGGDIASPAVLTSESLQVLPRVSQTSDFHCITTWSRRDIHWSGVRFKDFFAQIVVPEMRPSPDLRYVIFYSRDDYRTYFLLEDALAEDVLLADRLEGAPLTWEHGAPLRLVAPAHYGFRNPKHLRRIEFCGSLAHYRSPAMHWTEHPRARVSYEERGRWLPAWMYRHLFRAVVPVVLWWYRRAKAKGVRG